MPGYKENQDFISSILPQNILDDAIEWIQTNMCPEDVFTEDQLKMWADDWSADNGYIFEEEG